MNDHYVSGDEAAADAAARAYWAMEAAAPASSSPSSSGGKAKTATPSAAQAPAVLPFGVKARRRHYTHFSLFVVLDKSRCFLFYFVENTPSKYAVFLFSWCNAGGWCALLLMCSIWLYDEQVYEIDEDLLSNDDMDDDDDEMDDDDFDLMGSGQFELKSGGGEAS